LSAFILDIDELVPSIFSGQDHSALKIIIVIIIIIVVVVVVVIVVVELNENLLLSVMRTRTTAWFIKSHQHCFCNLFVVLRRYIGEAANIYCVSWQIYST